MHAKKNAEIDIKIEIFLLIGLHLSLAAIKHDEISLHTNQFYDENFFLRL
jgi:hypothetical protein